MYRQTDNRKVWYEWMVEVFKLEGTHSTGVASPHRSRDTTPVMMSGGRVTSPGPAIGKSQRKDHRRLRVGMSEMHSSIKDGCLM